MISLLFLVLGLLFIYIVICFFILITAIPAFLGAPFEPTKLENVKRMLRLAEPKENEVLYDLGSGDGRIIIEAVKKYKVKAIGIEINPLLVFISRKKIKNSGLENQAKIIWGDFFKEELSNADILTTYLLQKTNNRLEKKFIKELKPGTKIVSKSFIYKNIPFLKSDLENPEIRLYQIP